TRRQFSGTNIQSQLVSCPFSVQWTTTSPYGVRKLLGEHCYRKVPQGTLGIYGGTIRRTFSSSKNSSDRLGPEWTYRNQNRVSWKNVRSCTCSVPSSVFRGKYTGPVLASRCGVRCSHKLFGAERIHFS